MSSLKPTLVAVALAFLLVPAVAAANRAGVVAPQYRIKTSYAKQLVSSVATELHGHHGKGWSVSFRPASTPGPIGGATVAFRAKVKWGSGPHIAIALPEVTGVINLQKAPGAPKGKQRVTVLSPSAR